MKVWMYSAVASLVVQFALSFDALAQSQHVGEAGLSKDAWIDALKPKKTYKTRGIRFGSSEQEKAAEAAKPAPSVSLDVKFAYDSFVLTDLAKQQLKPLGEALNSDQLQDLAFKVLGHTDATGSDQYNMALSQKRAFAVGVHLHKTYGIELDRLKVAGRGESQLYDVQNPASGVNRRVEIATLSK